MKTPRREIIKKYTRAFLRVYKNQLVPHDLKNIFDYRTFLKQHRFIEFFGNTGYFKHEEKSALFLKAFYTSCPEAREPLKGSLEKLVTILAYHERLSLLPDILALIMHRFLEVLGYQEALVTTSQALNGSERQEVIESFKRLTGKNIEALFTVDPKLIAGMRIVSQDYLWELSIAQKIKALSIQL